MANLKENERALALEIYLNRTVTQAAIAREVGARLPYPQEHQTQEHPLTTQNSHQQGEQQAKCA